MEYKLCLACGTKFEKPKRFWSKKRWDARKYCGISCVDRGRKATTNWVKNLDKSGLKIGQMMSPNQKQKERIGSLQRGKLISNSYGAVHYWVRVTLGTPVECEHCGDTKKRKYWSNKDHKYSKNKESWQRLCYSCHREYDMALGQWG